MARGLPHLRDGNRYIDFQNGWATNPLGEINADVPARRRIFESDRVHGDEAAERGCDLRNVGLRMRLGRSTWETAAICRKTPCSSLLLALALGLTGCAAKPAAEALRSGAFCYDRAVQPQTALVDAHLHFRPFGGPAVPFAEVVEYMEKSGVMFANVMGIGQMLPVSSSCTYYLDCPGTPVAPTLKNDFINAVNYLATRPQGVHLTLAMTFPDLARPDAVLAGIRLLDQEFPGLFKWMGEVNLVKQALFNNGHRPVPLAVIRQWAPFMAVLRERNIPIAIHADLGNDEESTKYLPWMEEVLRLYPNNKIVWMHLGLSRELVRVDADEHIGVLRSLLNRHPNLMLDISWRVLEDNLFSNPSMRVRYAAFMNAHSERILPGTDFVASAGKDLAVYQEELEATSRILRHLDDDAFRNIALGRNYFRLLGLERQAPPICPARKAPG